MFKMITFLRPEIEKTLKIVNYNILYFRFCKLLVQEFNVKLDKGFILSVLDVFNWQKEEIREVN